MWAGPTFAGCPLGLVAGTISNLCSTTSGFKRPQAVFPARARADRRQLIAVFEKRDRDASFGRRCTDQRASPSAPRRLWQGDTTLTPNRGEAITAVGRQLSTWVKPDGSRWPVGAGSFVVADRSSFRQRKRRASTATARIIRAEATVRARFERALRTDVDNSKSVRPDAFPFFSDDEMLVSLFRALVSLGRWHAHQSDLGAPGAP
jgi:hypothetical protein